MSFSIGTSKLIFSDPVNRRLIGGVLLSVLLHALVLSLQFGVPGLGLPGVELPWKERRATVQPMTIQIANTQRAPAPDAVPPLPLPLPLPVPPTPVARTNSSAVSGAGITVLAQVKVSEVIPLPKKIRSQQKIKPVAPPTRLARPAFAPAETPTPVIAQDLIRDENFVMPLPSPEEPEHKAVESKDVKKKQELTPAETLDQTALSEAELAKPAELAIAKEQDKAREAEKADNLAKQVVAAQMLERQLAEVALKKLEEERRKQAETLVQKQLEKQLEESVKKQTEALALQKKLAAEEQEKRLQQQEAVRLETLRTQELKQQEALRRERLLTQEIEARKQAEALEKQQAAIRQKQVEEQAVKQKTEELAARQKLEELAARQKAEEQAARKAAEQRAAEQRALADALVNGKANAVGTTASANGDAAASGGLVLPKNIFSSDLANRAREQTKGWDVLSGRPPVPRQSDSVQQSRRRSVLGNFDREVPLRMYVESWRQKIERNGNFNYSQTSKDKARGDPVVIVAIRSDGSVEDITIVRSSGRADLDAAVSRIIRVNAPYAVFPPNIAAKYDVIEIRRVWRFDETLRIVEEIP
ncbi:MAG: TonB family protein [Undibacterium sp.]|nr:TonB family protein [Undibacterium sp.]